MTGIIMFAVFFILLVLLTILSRNKLNKEVARLEYEEWMKQRGYVKVQIEFLDDGIVCENLNIITKKYKECYIQSGVYNFIVCKNTFSDIEVYPVEFNQKNIKETKPIILNTGSFKNVNVVEY